MGKAVSVLPALAIVVFAAGASAANIVSNGDFETGDFTGWTVLTASEDGYNTLVDSGCAVEGIYGACSGPVYDTTDVYQHLPTEVGKTYRLEYWLRNNADTFNSFYLQIGSEWIDAHTLENSLRFDWVLRTFNFVASDTSTRLLFNFYNVPGFWDLDGVSVEALVPLKGACTASSQCETGCCRVNKKGKPGVCSVEKACR